MDGGDVDFGTETDVFAEIESDPLAGDDPAAPPPGVAEADLAGDNPSTETLADAEAAAGAAEPEPEPSAEPVEAELPGEAEALAAAEAAEPPAQAEPEPEPPAPAEPPAEPAPEPEPPVPEPEAAPAEPKKPKAKKPKKEKKSEDKKPAARSTRRQYVVLYEIEGGYAVGPTVDARNVQVAFEEAFSILSKQTGLKEFASMVAVPATNWKPQPVSGKDEVRHVVSIG